MRNYQLVLVFRPSLTDSQRKKLLDSVKNWLGDVKIAKEEEWGQKTLSYKIKGESEGVYFNFLLEGETVSLDFEKKLLAQEDVLRHLVLRLNIKNKTSKIEKKKEKSSNAKAEEDTKKK